MYYALFGPAALDAVSADAGAMSVVALTAGGLLGAVLRIGLQRLLIQSTSRTWPFELGAAAVLGIAMGALLGLAAGHTTTFFTAFGWVLTAFGAVSAYFAVTRSRQRFPAGTFVAVGHYAATQAVGLAGIVVVAALWSMAAW